MKYPDPQVVIASWLAIMILIVGVFLFNVLSKDAELKRKIWRWYMVVGGLVSGWWFYLLGGGVGLLFVIVLVPLTALLNWHTTRFCDARGKTLMNQFSRAKFCPRCGADLDAQDDARRRSSQ
jgi:hypothetical protein